MISTDKFMQIYLKIHSKAFNNFRIGFRQLDLTQFYHFLSFVSQQSFDHIQK